MRFVADGQVDQRLKGVIEILKVITSERLELGIFNSCLRSLVIASPYLVHGPRLRHFVFHSRVLAAPRFMYARNFLGTLSLVPNRQF
jgi:hypothetical protein